MTNHWKIALRAAQAARLEAKKDAQAMSVRTAQIEAEAAQKAAEAEAAWASLANREALDLPELPVPSVGWRGAKKALRKAQEAAAVANGLKAKAFRAPAREVFDFTVPEVPTEAPEVPEATEAPAEPTVVEVAQTSTNPVVQEIVRISLNSATLDELAAIPGVGRHRASLICAYRADHRFEQVEEVRAIPGIGPKTVEALVKYTTVVPLNPNLTRATDALRAATGCHEGLDALAYNAELRLWLKNDLPTDVTLSPELRAYLGEAQVTDYQDLVAYLTDGEYIAESDFDLLVHIANQVQKRLNRARNLAKSRALAMHRGTTYLPKNLILWDGNRLRSDTKIGGASLMDHVLRHEVGETDVPASFPIMDITLRDARNRGPGAGIDLEAVHRMNEAGAWVFKGRVGVPVTTLPPERVPAFFQTILNQDGSVNWEQATKYRRFLTPTAWWLMRAFEHAIDATYIPSIVTSPIEPKSFSKQEIIVAPCTLPDGTSMGMDGGGWWPMYEDGVKTYSRQVRAMAEVNETLVAYLKGESFVYSRAGIFSTDEGKTWLRLWRDEDLLPVLNDRDMTLDEFMSTVAELCELNNEPGFPDVVVGDIEVRLRPVFDIGQVKGRGKSWAKGIEHFETLQAYLGGLRYEQGRGTMNMASQAMQWLDADYNNPSECPVLSTIAKFQDRKIQRLVREGADGLLRRAARNMETLQTLLKVLEAMTAATGHEIDWQRVPMIRDLVLVQLGKDLYHGADGGGIEADSVVYQMCSSVPRGHCVWTGAKPGQEVMTYRYPMATHTSLFVMKNLDAADFPELWETPDGYVSRNRVAMNPVDLTERMQGDDDGDKGGISADRNLVAFAKKVWEHRVISCEVPAATKYEEPMWSNVRDIRVTPELRPGGKCQVSGAMLSAVSRRGAVGRTTLMQQRLTSLRVAVTEGGYQVSNGWGLRGLGLAWANQALIDQEKRASTLLDTKSLLRSGDGPFRHLEADEDGVYRAGDDVILRDDKGNVVSGDYDVDEIQDLVNKVLIHAGCYTLEPKGDKLVEKAGDPIQYRKINPGKRIDPNSEGWAGQQYWSDSGLRIESVVHWSFRRMEREWAKIRDSFDLRTDEDNDVPFGELLATALEMKGYPISPIEFDEYSLNEYRKLTGVSEFANEMRKASAIDYEDETARGAAKELIAQELYMRQSELTVDELANAFRLEAYEYHRLTRKARSEELEGFIGDAKESRSAASKCINNMMRMLNSEMSPLVQALGFSTESLCTYMDSRMDEIHAMCTDSRAKTFEAFMAWVDAHDRDHRETCGESIHTCPDCQGKIRQAFVKHFRNQRKDQTGQYFARLVGFANGNGEQVVVNGRKIFQKTKVVKYWGHVVVYAPEMARELLGRPVSKAESYISVPSDWLAVKTDDFTERRAYKLDDIGLEQQDWVRLLKHCPKTWWANWRKVEGKFRTD